MVVVSILEDQIQAAVGCPGRCPSLQKLFSIPYDRTLSGGWQKAVKELWEREGLPRKNITLVLPREKVMTRVIALPDMPPKRLSSVVSHEMCLSVEEDLVTDYMPLGGGRTMHDHLVASCRKSVLEAYVRGFETLGIKLRRITVPMASQLKVLSAMEEMKDKTCLWLLFEGSGVTTILGEKGKYGYAGRGRLPNLSDPAAFGRDVEKIVSGTMQFQERKRQGSAITHVYFAGCGESVLDMCRPRLEELGVRGQMLPGCSRCRAFPEGEHLRDWISCAGAFLGEPMGRKELDLYAAYRRGLLPQRRMPLYLPVVLVLLAGLAVVGVLQAQNQILEGNLGSLRRELIQEEAQYRQVRRKWLYNKALLDRMEATNALKEGRATYPKVTSSLMEEIAALGGEEIEMVLEGYDSEAGTLLFQARSHQVISIPDYVTALRETERFEMLEYSGYRYENEMYTLELRCVLKGEGGAS